MDILIDFLVDNYIWFLIITLILVFALIGYLVDITTPKLKKDNKHLVKGQIVDEDNSKVRTHPSLTEYTNEVFDEPLIDDKSNNF